MKALPLLTLALAVGLLACKEDTAAGAGAPDGATFDTGAEVASGDAHGDLAGDAMTDLGQDAGADLPTDTAAELPRDLAGDLELAETTYPVLCPEYVKAMKQCGMPVPPDANNFCANATQAFWRCYAESFDCQTAADCQLLL